MGEVELERGERLPEGSGSGRVTTLIADKGEQQSSGISKHRLP